MKPWIDVQRPPGDTPAGLELVQALRYTPRVRLWSADQAPPEALTLPLAVAEPPNGGPLLFGWNDAHGCKLAVRRNANGQPEQSPALLAQAQAQSAGVQGPWISTDAKTVQPGLCGAMAWLRHHGVNVPVLTLYSQLGHPVTVPNLFTHRVCQHADGRFKHELTYGHVYIDLDDTLLHPHGVDPDILSFVGQCRSRGVGVHLVTRHAGNVAATLTQHGLAEGLFDTVAHVTDPAVCKSTVIVHRDAFFMDDAFSERQRVATALGIPVFSPDLVEGLLIPVSG
jgi:hypothetical protein